MADRYPHQLSGGQQQRVVIAMGLACNPSLLILDEPTTGLDVTTEATILDLVAELKHESNAAIIYVSHNLGVIARVCDRVAVMYAGEIVEQAPIDELFANPRHPYTAGLLAAVPNLGRAGQPLTPIPGSTPARHAHPRRAAPSRPAAATPARFACHEHPQFFDGRGARFPLLLLAGSRGGRPSSPCHPRRRAVARRGQPRSLRKCERLR